MIAEQIDIRLGSRDLTMLMAPVGTIMTATLKLALIAVYLALSLYGLFKLKSEAFGINPGFIIGFLAYCSGFVIWLLILRLYPLSFAFPLAAGSLVCGTQLVGFLLLREPFGLMKVVGSIMVVTGIILLAVSDEVFRDG